MAGKEIVKVKEREFIVECIQLYRELPCLWNVKSKQYHDRDKKNTAYETLLSKYKEMFPQANKDDVKKKFNSLRTNYRKELKKHLQSMKSGCGTDDIYQPTLWYYNEMAFLQDQESASDSQSSIPSPREDSEHSNLDNNTQVNFNKFYLISHTKLHLLLDHFLLPGNCTFVVTKSIVFVPCLLRDIQRIFFI